MHGPCGIENCDCGHEIERIRQQRDELLAACEKAVPCIQWSMTHQPGNLVHQTEVLEAIEEALANCKD